MRILIFTAAAALTLTPAFCQKYEIGVAGGGVFSNSETIKNSNGGSATAGFNNGWAVSGNFGNNMYSHLGGEIRYTFESASAKLNGNGGSASFDALQHAIHYDLLWHATDTESTVRPYVAGGGGVKWFQGTGKEVAVQPLSDIALLTKTTEMKGMLSVGGGVKVKLTGKYILRLDVHDYLTPFPTKVIAPVPGSSSPGGWINNIVVTAGLTMGVD